MVAPLIIAALIGGAASLGGAMISAGSARRAGRAQSEAASQNRDLAFQYTDESLADFDSALQGAVGQLRRGAEAADQGYQRGIGALSNAYDRARSDVSSGYSGALSALNRGYSDAAGFQQPFYSSGTRSLSELTALLGLNGTQAANDAMGRFQTSPGYQFQMEQGVGALDRSAAARGGLYSGAQGKALTEYGQGLANQEFNNRLMMLSDLASRGQQAGGTLSSLSASQGQQAGDLMANRGLALADVATQRGRALSDMYVGQGGVAGGYNSAIAQALLGGAGQRAGIRLSGLQAATGANTDVGNAAASQAINVGNAWNSGLSNISQLAGYVGGQMQNTSAMTPTMPASSLPQMYR